MERHHSTKYNIEVINPPASGWYKAGSYDIKITYSDPESGIKAATRRSSFSSWNKNIGDYQTTVDSVASSDTFTTTINIGPSPRFLVGKWGLVSVFRLEPEK